VSLLPNYETGLDVDDLGFIDDVSIVIHVHALLQALLSRIQLVSIFIVFDDI